MKKPIIILSFAAVFMLFFACRSSDEILVRNSGEMKNSIYAYEITNITSQDIQYAQSKGQIEAVATVTQTHFRQTNAAGRVIKSTKQLKTDDGKIIISIDHKNKLTTVVGDLKFGNIDLYKVNGVSDTQNKSGGHATKLKQTLLEKYDIAGDVLCRAVAQYKLIEKMNEVGAQAVFMPNYNWTYRYDDMISADWQSGEECSDTVSDCAEKTVITVKITATAISFVK